MKLYRGMAQVELDSARATGYFSTSGQLNAGHAAGLYCMTTDYNEAVFYANRSESGVVVEFDAPDYFSIFKDEEIWSTEVKVPIGQSFTSGKVVLLPSTSIVNVTTL